MKAGSLVHTGSLVPSPAPHAPSTVAQAPALSSADVQIGDVTIEGVSDGSLGAPPTLMLDRALHWLVVEDLEGLGRGFIWMISSMAAVRLKLLEYKTQSAP